MQFPKWVIIAGVQKDCRAYYMAKDRCTNPNNKDYARYGKRGITFELTGLKDLLLKLGLRPKGWYLDRIDNNGPYHLDNVKWSSPKESAQNKLHPLGRSGHTNIYIRKSSFVVNHNGKYAGTCRTFEAAVKLKESL